MRAVQRGVRPVAVGVGAVTARFTRDHALVLGGGVLLVVAAAAWEIPGIFAKVSLSQAHAVCSSSLGALGTLLSPKVQTACSHVSLWTSAVALVAVASVAVVLVAGVMTTSYRFPVLFCTGNR